MDDLQAAISKAELAVSATLENHPDRAGRLHNLAINLLDRYNLTENFDDVHTALRSYIGSFDLPNASPLIRLSTARNALSYVSIH